VAEAAGRRGWGTVQVTPSPLPGPSGNVEFFLWLRKGGATVDAAQIEAAVRAGSALGVPGEKVDP
jgi:23S rRNA (cytidine1920-2'-O)/16S rRNA (cytidine1409-2'-O)-methyltransferase